MRKLRVLLKDIVTLLLNVSIILKMLLDKKNGKTIVVYHLSSPGQFQYLKPYHRELAEKENFAFYVSMTYPIHAHLAQLNIDPQHSFPAHIARYLFLIDIFLETEIDGRGPKRAIKIFTGHGHMHKYSHWAEENLKAFDAYFLHSPLEKQMFEVIKTQSPKSTQHIQLFEIGYPKLDDLVNNNYSRTEVLKQLNLDPSLKTVIYSPSWDPGGSLRTHGTKIVETLLTIENINVIVKLHPVSLEPRHSPHFAFYTGGKDWKNEFSIFNHDPRFKFITDYFINPYLFVSDLMVNDYSGVGLEYMVLNRPIVYIECPEYYDKTLPSWQSDGQIAKNDERFNGGRNSGTIVHSLSELKIQVELELKQPELNEYKRKRMTEMIMYNPGRGANIGVQTILKLLEFNS